MTKTTGDEEENEIYYEDFDSRASIIVQCYNALAAVEMLDPYDKKGQAQRDRIRKKSLEVLDYYVSEIHAEIFDTHTEDEQ